MPEDRIVSIAFLTRLESERLSATLAHCYPLANDASFDRLLLQLDRIEIESPEDALVIRPEPDGIIRA